MQEITIDKNEKDQRIDRFLKKMFPKASKGFIYKMLRKKRIKLNGAKANPSDIIIEGDKIQMYLADDTINKFKGSDKEIKSYSKLNIIYEDSNIVLINKPKGLLSHGTNNSSYENNVVDQLVSYLYNKKEYIPRLEKTFTPSICNRLDRNTSGIIIGAKNYDSLKIINKAIKENKIKKIYICVIKGKIEKNTRLIGFLTKNEEKNKVYVSKTNNKDSKKIITDVKVLKTNGEYSLLEIDLITGRTHQIRAHLSSIGCPIIGDTKYGNKKINKYFLEKYGLKSQFLHAHKIVFNNLHSPMDYLNKKEFIADIDDTLNYILRDLFEG